MPKPTEAEIKAVLTASFDARRKLQANALRDRGALQTQLKAQQQEKANLVRDYFKKTGLDVAKLESITAASRKEIASALRKQDADNSKRSQESSKSSAKLFANQKLLVDLIPPIGPAKAGPSFSLLGKPLLIFWTPGIRVSGNPFEEPWHNTVICGAEYGEGFRVDQLHFVFFWQNPSDKYTVLDFSTGLYLRGFLNAYGDSGLIDPGESTVGVEVIINAWNWTTQTSTQILAGGAQETATGGLFDPTVTGELVDQEFLPSYPNFILPGNDYALFDVVLQITGGNDANCVSSADFSNPEHGYEVVCPGVIYTILT